MPRQSIFSSDNSAKSDVTNDGNISPVRSNPEPAGNGSIDPATIGTTGAEPGTADSGGNSGDGSRPKRKYRKRSSAQAGETLSVEGLAGILYSCHTMLSVITKSPELMLDEKEANAVAQASVNVSRHYGFAPSSKSVDWAHLMMTLGAVYGTRLIAIKNRKSGERKTKPQEAPQQAEPLGDNVVQWPPYPNDGMHNV